MKITVSEMKTYKIEIIQIRLCRRNISGIEYITIDTLQKSKHSWIKSLKNKQTFTELWTSFNRTNMLIPKGGQQKIMVKIFPNLIKTINSQIQKMKKKTSKCKKTTPKHIIIKLLKTSDYQETQRQMQNKYIFSYMYVCI